MLKSISKASPAFKALNQKTTRGFAGFGSKRKPTRKDLDKYDIVVVGGNLGSIFSRHLDDDAHGKYSMMVVLNESVNQLWPLRTVYEQQRCSKTDYMINAKQGINMYTASEVTTVDKFLPEENAIVLRNGRKIQYEQLVVSMGLKEDFDAVPGLEDAFADVDHPVFCPKDHSSWRSFHHPYPRWHYNFTGGDAYFCIPPYPYKGELSTLNFFISNQVWKWYQSYGKLSPKHSFTIVNANDHFCKNFDVADQFIKEKIQKLGLNVEYGVNLKSIDKQNQEAVFENTRTGNKETRKYSQIYSVIPCKPHEQLVESGLAHKGSDNLLDVNIKTLQHNKFKNVFGIGDVNNLPTTKTFYGGFHQVHVVRNNVQRNLKGLPLNAEYSGYSKASILLSQNEITYAVHYYDQKPHFQNLLAKNGGIIASMRYYFWAKAQKKRLTGWYMKKSWGPPTFKLKRTFKALPTDKDHTEKKSIFQAFNKSVDDAAHKIVKSSETAPVLQTAGGAANVTDKIAKDAKDTANNVKEAVNHAAKSTADAVKNTTGKDVEKTAKDAAQNVKNTTKEAAENIKSSAKGAAESVKKTVNDATGDAKVVSGDVAGDAKAYVKEAVKDAKETVKDAGEATEKKGIFEAIKDSVTGIAREQRGKLGQSSAQTGRDIGDQVGENIAPERDQAPKDKQSKPSSK